MYNTCNFADCRLEAHAWIYRRLSFAVMRGVAEQLVRCLRVVTDFVVLTLYLALYGHFISFIVYDAHFFVIVIENVIVV